MTRDPVVRLQVNDSMVLRWPVAAASTQPPRSCHQTREKQMKGGAHRSSKWQTEKHTHELEVGTSSSIHGGLPGGPKLFVPLIKGFGLCVDSYPKGVVL